MREHRDAAFFRAIGHQRHLLEPAVFTAGLEAELGEAICDVLCRRIVAGLARHPAFARIVGKPRDVRLERVDCYDAISSGCPGLVGFAARSDRKRRKKKNQVTPHCSHPCTVC